MEKLNPSCAALLFAIFQLFLNPKLGACFFDCSQECFSPYLSSQPLDCDSVTFALQCYESNRFDCEFDGGSVLYFSQARIDQVALCENTTTSTVMSAGTPDAPCPSLTEETYSPVTMSSAVILPEFSPPECSMLQVPSLRQCSMFMDSQLRAFDSYRAGLETCSLPGSWHLFNHPSLTIEVEGTGIESEANRTRLTSVNVTFHAHECNPTATTYTAYNSMPLASNFTPDSSNSVLQLAFGADGSVVTLMATWLNATIIIRQHAEFLSVTLQVPRVMSLEGEGLCTGCPSHMYVNITSFNSMFPSLCPDLNLRVLTDCFDHGGVVNQNELLHIQNNSYLDACVYHLFKIRTSDVLSMFSGIADDAKLLVNVGDEPLTFPTISSSSSSSNSPTATSTSPSTSNSSSDETTTQSSTIMLTPTISASTSCHVFRLPQTLFTSLIFLLSTYVVQGVRH